MNTFSTQLMLSLAPKHLLKHDFYQAWNKGELTNEELRYYARQYFKHVNAFPRYISATHSLCENIQDRQVLLENLIDEEQGTENHPELWMRFAEGLGESRENVLAEAANPAIEKVVSTFERLSKSSYAEGLGALFAYEQQVPEVAATKIDGLEKFYHVKDERSLSFFNVHLKADVYHSQACSAMMDKLSPEEKVKASEAAHEAADALWDFLSSMPSGHCKEENMI